MRIQSCTANFTWRHAFEKSVFHHEAISMLEHNKKEAPTSASYQTFSFSLCWKKAPETWRCRNQLHHSDDPPSVEPCLFFNQSFCSACDDDIWYAFAKSADLSGDWALRDDRRRMFTMQHDCVTAQVSEDGKGLICQRCQRIIFFASIQQNPTTHQTLYRQCTVPCTML